MGYYLTGALIAAGLHLVGTILITVAVASPNWIVVDINGQEVNQGLFEACYGSVCLMLDTDMGHLDFPDSLYACRGTNISGLILAAMVMLAVVAWLLNVRSSNTRWHLLPDITLAISTLAALLVCISLVVYGLELYRPAEKWSRFGSCFYMDAIGALLLLVGDVAFRIMAKKYVASSQEVLECGQTYPASPASPSPSPLFFFNVQNIEHPHSRGLVYQRPHATVLLPPKAYSHHLKDDPKYQSQFRDEPPTYQSEIEDELPTYEAQIEDEPPMYQAQITEESPRYEVRSPEECELIDRALQEGEYTPGEVRKAAPGSSSI